MPLQKLKFQPGINRDTTNYANEGGWYECDKIRFFAGYPQKIGGWVEATSERAVGTCRQMWNWATSYTDNFLAVGTNAKVYIEAGGVYYDITPLRATFNTPDTDNCIETTDTETTVTVNLGAVAHGCTTGDYVTISGVTGNPGGVPDAEINTEHIVTVVDPYIFTFEVTTAATSTTSGGGGASIVIACQITKGYPSVTAGYGWGTGAWDGDYGWGLASSTPVYLPQRDWWFDNFNNNLIMNIRADTTGAGVATGGPIYYWERGTTVDPSAKLATRAVLLSSLVGASDVPSAVGQILIAQNNGHLLAFGCTPEGSSEYDPLLIRWASQDAPQYWTDSDDLAPNGAVSSAGGIRVSRGSGIVRAIPTRQEIVVLTDTHVYSLQFLANEEVFGLQELTDNISIISPRAVTTANNVLYWMGVDKFYRYDGRTQTLPCTLREHVFKDINYAQADQIICGTNEGFNEIWWFYPSSTSDWVDKYVIYNHLQNVWYYGNLGRTAWLDTATRDTPSAMYTPENQVGGGILYSHEVGVNANTLPIDSYIQSSDFDLGEGDDFILTRRLIPDINFNQSTTEAPEVSLTVRSRDWPGSNFQNDPSDTQRVVETSVGRFTNQVFIRARGRQMALRIASNQEDMQWQLGDIRLDGRKDGRR